ncbi:WD40-repeat-containing domain protein [Lenzites betulinus]|nr:WD40-repeat-containing domain protein [Lenzites betulinus]
MVYFPYTRLIVGDQKALAVSGHHFHVLNVHTGEIVHSTTKIDEQAQEKLEKSGAIRCAAVDSHFTHIITTADDKRLKVWRVGEDFALLSERDLPKKPTEIGFTGDGQTVVISDKFGDVFSYPLHPDPSSESSTSHAGAPKRGSLTAHENPSNGTLILGHASMLTTYLLTADDQYVVTADRDEHIRISWFPKGYVIERYCLGHEKFVSALHIPPFHSSTLISGGGDPTIKVWDWMSGKLLGEIAVFDAVEPHIKVKAPKRRHAWDDGDGDGETGASEVKNKGKGKGRRRGKGKKGTEESTEADRPTDEASEDPAGKPAASGGDVPMTDADTPAPRSSDAQPASDTSDDFQLVFAVHRIQSVDRGEHGRFILFTAVGASAVFYAPFPANGETLPASAVHAVAFEQPVVDFDVSQEGQAWVLLDPNWGSTPDGPSSDSDSAAPVRLLSWQDGTLTAVPGAHTPLTTALNSNCRVPATAAQLKALDLYAALAALPKNVDPEHDAVIRDTLSEAAAAASVDGAGADGKPLTQRELGRLRKKKALLAKIQEQEQLRQASREGTADVVEAEREVKKARSEGTGEQPVVDPEDGAREEARDVDMIVS